MGCKQYNRMLGLSRGYPHILYLSLNKWDAAPNPSFSTRHGSARLHPGRPRFNRPLARFRANQQSRKIRENHSWLLKPAGNDKQKKSEWHDYKLCHPNLPWFRFFRDPLRRGPNFRSCSRRHLGPG